MKTLLNRAFVLQAEFRWLIRFLGALVEQDDSISVSVCVNYLHYLPGFSVSHVTVSFLFGGSIFLYCWFLDKLKRLSLLC